MSQKKKVAILGGGPGGLTAAHFLAESSADLDITIYTMGWRLGGKGASGRNQEMAERIEEHGIHLFGNFYPNALHMVKDCYDSVDEFEKQFLPMNLQMLTEFYDDRWHRYAAHLATSGKQPWQTEQVIEPLDQLTEKVINNVYEIFKTREMSKQSAPPSPAPHWLGRLFAPFVRNALNKTFPHGDGHLSTAHSDDSYVHGHTWKQSFATRVLRFIMNIMRAIAHRHARVRYIYIQLDHLIGCVHGFKLFDLEHKGIGSINHWDHLRWLRYCGVSDMTLASPVVKAIPNVCFQFPEGDTTGKPSMAASAYMTYVLRQLLASGDDLFFFRKGTGETAIKPMYDKLIEKGVKVEFFHKVVDVVPSDRAHEIQRIKINVQAQIRDECKPYNPIEERTIDGTAMRVWSATMPYDQLVDCDAMKEKCINLESWWNQPQGADMWLELGKDFDYVVMAIPFGAHPFAAPSLLDTGSSGDINHAQKVAWQSMHENVHTIPTQAFQMWLTEPIDALGLPDRLLKNGERWAGPSYNNPMSGWTDFSDLIQYDGWTDAVGAGHVPKTLVYFCGAMQQLENEIPLADPTFPGRQYERVKSTIVQELSHLNGLLPASVRDDETRQMRFELLQSPIPAHESLRGEQRVADQYVRVNVDPNERYTVSPPGHEKHLKYSWDSGYSNLAMAGDWIFTGFNIGSFEGSVMSGKLASYALTGYPEQEKIYGFDFLREPLQPDNVPMIK